MKKYLGLSLLAFLQFSCGQNEKKETAETAADQVTEQAPSRDVKETMEAVSNDKGYEVETVVEGINIPWGIEFLPGGDLLVTEKSGKIYRVHNGEKAEISHPLHVYNRGQGGLLDVTLHPNYEENGWIYFSYASDEGEGEGGNTAIARGKLEGNALTSVEQLYKASPNTTKGQHFGSRIEFDNDGYLYFSAGERGDHDINPQDITRDNGKVYRLYDDGRIPEDNPFYNTENAKKAIYSYGHRNPQGMLKHYKTGEIWVHEHGPQGGDEINIVKAGANYGWPVVCYGIDYDDTLISEYTEKEGIENPIHYWVPSIAPSGMTFVTSDVYPDWKGDLMVGSLKFGYVERMVLDQNNQLVKREKLMEGLGRVREVKQGPDGYLYVGVEGTGVVKIVPTKA